MILLTVALCLATTAASANNGKIVFVTVGSVSLDEITASDLPNISRLIKTGAIGVMNARPASIRAISDDAPVGRYSMEGGCATIGAGTRTAATTDARKAYNSSEKIERRSATQLYESLYGRNPGNAQVLHLGMNRLWFVNSEARYPIEPGAIGALLRSNGHKTAAIGNSDTPIDPRREASLIAADPYGIIDYGNVSSSLTQRDPTAPYGIRTNEPVLIKAFNKVVKHADFIVVDVGDTSRAASYAQHCVDEQGMRLRHHSLQNADKIIGHILKSIDLSRDRIIVISPNPSPQAIDLFDLLPPIIVAGNGIRQGILTSGSTQRPGIITNADVSALILDFFDITAPYSFVGRSVEVLNSPAATLTDINHRIILQMERQPAMRGVASFLIGFVILLSLYAFQRRWRQGRWASWIALLPIALILAILWLPAIACFGLIKTVVLLAGVTLGIIIAALVVIRSPMKAFAWLCGAVAVTVVADLARGAFLLRDSILSYTPVDGARYYGIGNEHMGSAISAAVIASGFFATLLAKKKALRMLVLNILMAIIVVAIGLPSLGANAGGAMSAVAAAVVGLILWRDGKIDKKRAIIAFMSVAVSLGFLFVIDSMRPGGAQSHVGRTAHLIRTGGAGEILIVIGRKISMNIMLIQHSAWSKLLIVSVIAVITMLSARHLSVLERLGENKYVYSGLVAATVGTIAALILNDSGVVAAATAFIYVWTAVIIAALSRKENGEQELTPSSPARASEVDPVVTTR
jgi:hypothetical protein